MLTAAQRIGGTLSSTLAACEVPRGLLRHLQRAVNRAAGGPPVATLADRESALPPSRGAARPPPPEPRGDPRRAGAMSSQRLVSSHRSNQLAGLPTIWCP